jgi:hypothetical protein
LTHGLVKTNPGGDGDVEALHCAEHGNLQQLIAGLAHQTAHAGALGAHHQHRGLRPVGGVDIVGRGLVSTHHPQATILQFAQAAHQIGHHEIGHGFRRAAGHASHGGVEPDRAIFRRNDQMHPRRVGSTKDGAEVVRIGHAIERQHQRRALHGIEHGVQVVHSRQVIDLRHYALMTVGARQRGQALGAEGFQLHARGLDFAQELLHARIAPTGIDIHRVHRGGSRTQARAHRVESVERLHAATAWGCSVK